MNAGAAPAALVARMLKIPLLLPLFAKQRLLRVVFFIVIDSSFAFASIRKYVLAPIFNVEFSNTISVIFAAPRISKQSPPSPPTLFTTTSL